jgi:hypothetical protein
VVCVSPAVACNGVCVNEQTDVSNCGACGKVCSSTNLASNACTSAKCSGTCVAGYADCNNNLQADGCETNVISDPNNCGACGIVCSAGLTCSMGQCLLLCTAPAVACNEMCVNEQTDTRNCGGCGTVCSSNNVSSSACTSGKCGGACVAAFADCDNNLQTDGCETNIAGDPNNCGACGAVCSSNNVPSTACTSGKCSGACAAGFADCNANLQTDGCETNTSNDSKNCGACGNVCPSAQSCVAGACECPAGEAMCGAACVNESTDPNNCGACGNVCPSGGTCGNGTCPSPCPANEILCGGTCVDETTDPNNCGSCGNQCAGPGATCNAGVCAFPVSVTFVVEFACAEVSFNFDVIDDVDTLAVSDALGTCATAPSCSGQCPSCGGTVTLPTVLPAGATYNVTTTGNCTFAEGGGATASGAVAGPVTLTATCIVDNC